MPEVKGVTAHEVIKNTIEYVNKNGTDRIVWGGTIPEVIGDPASPNDYERRMIEMDNPITIVLSDPYKNWCDISDHWVGITLRETEDHLQAYNPGYVIKYSKLYRQWLEDRYFNYTYGERFLRYPYNLEQLSGKHKNVGWDINQIEKIIKLLREHPTSRKACISTWYPPTDLGNNYCPCNAFFQIREQDGLLTWTTVIRSLDVLRGLTENIFMFTLWQQYIANRLNMDVGAYKTVALNAHLYSTMVSSGYHRQILPDPYEHYDKQNIFETPFPSDEFNAIDNLLFADMNATNSDKILRKCLKLPTYWCNWKLSLVSDWYRRCGHIDKSMEILENVNNEFMFSVARRIKHGDVLDMLPFTKQREYLKKNWEI